MMYIEGMTPKKRLMKDVPGSYFLFGPRGTGKTTWLDERFPNAVRISLLDSAIRRELRAFPERLKNYIGRWSLTRYSAHQGFLMSSTS